LCEASVYISAVLI